MHDAFRGGIRRGTDLFSTLHILAALPGKNSR